MLHVRIAGKAAPVAVLQQSARGAAMALVAEGSPVWLTWPPEVVVLLDKD